MEEKGKLKTQLNFPNTILSNNYYSIIFDRMLNNYWAWGSMLNTSYMTSHWILIFNICVLINQNYERWKKWRHKKLAWLSQLLDTGFFTKPHTTFACFYRAHWIHSMNTNKAKIKSSFASFYWVRGKIIQCLLLS